MGFNDIRNAREGFVDMGAGDKLIRVESIIVGIVLFIVMLSNHTGFVPAVVVAALTMFVFPWLVGLVEIFAWIAAIVFSLAWAVVGYFIGGALLGDSVAGGIVIAVIIFIVSFFLHKIFGGLGYVSNERHIMDSLDTTRDNTSQMANVMTNQYSQNQAAAGGNRFCSCCGARISAGSQFCSSCGSRQ